MQALELTLRFLNLEGKLSPIIHLIIQFLFFNSPPIRCFHLAFTRYHQYLNSVFPFYFFFSLKNEN